MTEPKSILRAAICEFKKSVERITKDSFNPFHTKNYADMGDILKVIDRPLAEAGLTVTSTIKYDKEGDLICETNLMHKDSDECLSSIFPIFGVKSQEIGASVTYARRYNLQALLNLAAEDDDGEGSVDATKLKKGVDKDGKPTASANKKKYQEYIECLAKVKTKEMYLKVKGHKDAWVMWVKNNYAEEWADQLNDVFLNLAAEYDNPLPKDTAKTVVSAVSPETTTKEILKGDDIPDFLK